MPVIERVSERVHVGECLRNMGVGTVAAACANMSRSLRYLFQLSNKSATCY